MKNWRKGIIRKFYGGKKKDYGEFIQLLNKNILDLEYDGAKEMLLVEDVDNKEFLTGLFNAMYNELPAPKPKKKK